MIAEVDSINAAVPPPHYNDQQCLPSEAEKPATADEVMMQMEAHCLRGAVAEAETKRKKADEDDVGENESSNVLTKDVITKAKAKRRREPEEETEDDEEDESRDEEDDKVMEKSNSRKGACQHAEADDLTAERRGPKSKNQGEARKDKKKTVREDQNE